jgi:hypothetical protein
VAKYMYQLIPNTNEYRHADGMLKHTMMNAGNNQQICMCCVHVMYDVGAKQIYILC